LQREVYRQLAKDGSNMFFIIKGLTRMDNMYQYSLDVFFRIFDQALRTPSNGASPVGRKPVCRTISEMTSQTPIILPRQARDKHSEKVLRQNQKRPAFLCLFLSSFLPFFLSSFLFAGVANCLARRGVVAALLCLRLPLPVQGGPTQLLAPPLPRCETKRKHALAFCAPFQKFL
jgi:hypothetical protein